MANEWKQVPLFALAELSGGFAFKSRDYASKGRFVLRTLNITDDGRIDKENAVFIPEDMCHQYARFELQPEDTLFVMVGATLGKVGFVRGAVLPALLNQNMWRIRAIPGEACARYVHYAFRQSAKRNLAWASGSARSFVRRDDYRNLEIPCPPLVDQRAIAHILGTLDDKIELNRKMSETLEGIARTIFKSWFVEFDPVRDKAEGRDTGLPDHLAELFPDKLVDSELGEIPATWTVGAVERIAELNPESWKKRDLPKRLRYVDLSGTSWGKITSVAEYQAEDAPSRARRVLRAGDSIVGTVRPGNGSYSLVMEDGLTGSTGFAVLRPKKPVHTYFAYLATTRHENIENLAHLADGAAYPAVRPKVVAATEIVYPTPEVFEAFHTFASPVFQRIALADQEILVLTELRDTLLPKLISGELRIDDPDRFLQEVIS